MGKLLMKGLTKEDPSKLEELKAGYEKTIKDLRDKVAKLEKENAALKKAAKKEEK